MSSAQSDFRRVKPDQRNRKPRFWRLCRLYFRRFRIIVWLLLLVLLGGLVYINQIGLPGFVKRPLLDNLRGRGLNLEFSRLRVRWFEGVVAENVTFQRAGEPSSPRLTVAELQVLLNWHALAHLQLQVDAVTLRQGRLTWPLATTNNQELSLENIQTNLRFLTNDCWALDHFKARFAGARIELSGMVTNASAIRDWPFPQGAARAPEEIWHHRLRDLAGTLDQIRFSASPELRLLVRGDARILESFNIVLLVAAPGARTPWGDLAQGRLTARLLPASSNGLLRIELNLNAADAQTRWGSVTNLILAMKLIPVEGRTNLVEADLELSAKYVQTQWGSGANALFNARWLHSFTNPVPISGHGDFRCDSPQTPWANARRLQLAGSLLPASSGETPAAGSPAWAWWTNLQPYQLEWDSRLLGLQTTNNLTVDDLACAGTWQAPALTLTNVQASLYGGQVAAQATLDIASRALTTCLTIDLDPKKLETFLPAEAQQALGQVTWARPPHLTAEAFLVLPAWTDPQPDWQGEVLPTLQLRGELRAPRGGAFRGLQAFSVQSHFIYSNRCLHLPDLAVTRPEGWLEAEHRADDRTKDFYWRIASTLDPTTVRPLLGEQEQSVFDLVTLTQPPVIQAEIWGRYQDADRTGFKGRIGLTNFTFRGEAFTGVQTALQYTNRVLQFLAPRVQRGVQQATADGLTADFNTELVYLTNAYSTTEPLVIARVIGTEVAQAIEPYQFSNPPIGYVHGTIPMRGEAGADLHFDLDGGPFHWWKFNLDHLAGHVHWAGLHLTLEDVHATFYDGQASGAASFDFVPDKPTAFEFAFGTTNSLLHSLMKDLSSPTNRLEGLLSGVLAVTKANTGDWRSANGYGEAYLNDGLLWDIPLFGIFSPVLNGIAPGLGNSRASAAKCSFVLTNGVLFTDDLFIRSTGMRLDYRGTVDLQGQVQARVEAQLLRDMWLVGPLVSTVFWPVTKLFEYKVRGDLGDPKSEPVFIVPKLVLFPFHPLRSLKGLFQGNTSPDHGPNPPQWP
jgi:hypothetical protein